MRIRTALAPLAATAALLAAATPALAYDNAAWIPMIGGNPPLVKWAYDQLPNGNNPGVIFVFQTPTGEVSNVFGFSVPVPLSLGKEWIGKWDDPAPLLWYAQHVDPTWLGWRVFGWGPGPDQHTPLSPQLIAVMNQEHFAPSMVGGYDVPGLTAGSSAAPPAPSSAPTSAPPPATPSADSNGVAAPTPTPSTTHGAAPAEPPASSPSPGAANGSAAAAAQPTRPSTAASAPSAAPAVQDTTAPSAPPSATPPGEPASPSAVAGLHRPGDPRPTAPRHGFPWPDLVGALVVAAAGGYGVWRWRQAR